MVLNMSSFEYLLTLTGRETANNTRKRKTYDYLNELQYIYIYTCIYSSKYEAIYII